MGLFGKRKKFCGLRKYGADYRNHPDVCEYRDTDDGPVCIRCGWPAGLSGGGKKNWREHFERRGARRG